MAETTFVRTHKDRNYTVLDNTFIRDVSLSWKAKGVMTYLLSLPDDWSVNFSEVLRHSADGETALKNTIKELKEHGYLISKRLQSAEGKFTGFTYEIVENPKANNQQTEKPSGGKPTEWKNHPVENDQLLNTYNTKYLNKQNTYSINSDEKTDLRISVHKDKHSYGEFKNVWLTDVEYDRLKSEYPSEIDAIIQHFSELKEMKGYVYKNDNLALRKWGIRAYHEQNSRQSFSKNNRDKEGEFTEIYRRSAEEEAEHQKMLSDVEYPF